MRPTRRRNVAAITSSTRRWSILIVAVIAIALGAVAASWRAATPDAAGGTPRLEIDQRTIDLGDQVYSRWVTAVFTVRNSGDGPLEIASGPSVHAAKGC